MQISLEGDTQAGGRMPFLMSPSEPSCILHAGIDVRNGSQFPCTTAVRRPGPREVWQTKRGGGNHLDGRRSLAPVPSPRDPLLGEIVRRLIDAYRPERIYLFGSTARGDAGPDS